MGVQIKQAKYAGPGVSGDPPVPESGHAQPLIDTSATKPQPGVVLAQANATGGRHLRDSSPSVPDCASPHPEGSTDFINQDYKNLKDGGPPADIYKGGKGNG